jgi:glycosyltransferase involved in cell wall biosynthesis
MTDNSMENINLSYVITTYNKLPYLKNVVSTLLKNIGTDEEVVVTDGGSKDGTKEYLEELFKAGKIHQFISEKDAGESNGWNKAFLLAKGTIIKVITDDDAFDYDEIKKCKEFMLSHPEIDILGTDGVFTKAVHESSFIDSESYSAGFFNVNSDYSNEYNNWKNNSKPFTFCGLGWMLRRKSIPLIGLLDTSFVRADAEYTLKITSGKANVGWYTGKVWARIFNPNSNSLTQNSKIKRDTIRLNRMYPGTNLSENDEPKKWHDYLPESTKTLLRKVKNKALGRKNTGKSTYVPDEKDWENVFKLREEKLYEINKREKGVFLYRNDK